MPRPQGSLQRSLQSLAIGTVKGREAREKELRPTRLGELAQVMQFQVSGTANNFSQAVDVPIMFPAPFVRDPTQRDVDFEDPNMSVGIQILTPEVNVMIFPALVAWQLDDADYYIGATIRVVVWVGSEQAQTFAVKIHLTFMGRGAPVVPDSGDPAEPDLNAHMN